MTELLRWLVCWFRHGSSKWRDECMIDPDTGDRGVLWTCIQPTEVDDKPTATRVVRQEWQVGSVVTTTIPPNLQPCPDDPVTTTDVEYFCSLDTGTIQQSVTQSIDGVAGTPVITDTGEDCDPGATLDFEQTRVCSTATRTIHIITNSIAQDGTTVQVGDVDTGESCEPECVVADLYRIDPASVTSTLIRKEWSNLGLTPTDADDSTALITLGRDYKAQFEVHPDYEAPDVSDTVTNLGLNDIDNSVNVVTVTTYEGWVVADQPVLGRYNPSGEGYICVEMGFFGGALQRVTDQAGTAIAQTSEPVINVPKGIHRWRVTMIDLGGTNTSANFQTSADGTTWATQNGAMDQSVRQPCEETVKVKCCGDVATDFLTGDPVTLTDYRAAPLDSGESYGGGSEAASVKVLGEVCYLKSSDVWDPTTSALIGTTGGIEVVQIGDATLTIEIEDDGLPIEAYSGGLAPRVSAYNRGTLASREVKLTWSVPEGCVLSYMVTGNYIWSQGGANAATRFDPCPTSYKLTGDRQRFIDGWLFSYEGNSNAVSQGMTVQVVGEGSVQLTMAYAFTSFLPQAIRNVQVDCYSTATVCESNGIVSYQDLADPAQVVTEADLAECPVVEAQPVDCGGECAVCGDGCEDLTYRFDDTVHLNSSWYNVPSTSQQPTDQVHMRVEELEPVGGNAGRLWAMAGLTTHPTATYYTRLDYTAYVYRPAAGSSVQTLYAYENNNGVTIGSIQPDDVVSVEIRGSQAVLLVNGEWRYTYPTPVPADKTFWASTNLLNNGQRGAGEVQVSTCPIASRADECETGCCDEVESWPMSAFDTDAQPNNGWANQGPYSTCPVRRTTWTLGEKNDRIPMMFGLGETDPLASASYTTFRHRIYWYQTATGANRYGVYDDGVFQGWSAITDIPVGTEFCITQLPDGHISYTRDGVEFYRSAAAHPAPMYADSSILGGGASAYWNGSVSWETENSK